MDSDYKYENLENETESKRESDGKAERKRAPAGPDQGYAWVVALACFSINFTIVGLSRSVGVMYTALVQEYGITREQATLPFSIRMSAKNFTAPLTGLLALKYGIRKVTSFGVLVAALGSTLCYIAPNITWITILWGGIHGIGFGLSAVVHIMVISQYFDKYKARALGFGYSGDCFGTFVFPVLMEYLLDTYGVRGTFLILGGIVLNVLPSALLLRKPPWLENKTKSRQFSKNITQQSEADIKDQNTNFYPSEGYQNDGFSKLEEDLSPNNNDDVAPHQSSEGVSQFCNDINEHQDLLKKRHIDNREIDNFMTEVPPETVRHDFLPPVFGKEIKAEEDQQEISSISVNIQTSNTETNDGQGLQFSSRIKKRSSSLIGQVAHDIVNRMRSSSFAGKASQDFFIKKKESDSEEECSRGKEDQSILKSRQAGSMTSLNSRKKEVVLPASAERETSILVQSEETEKPRLLRTFIQTNAKPIFILISMSMAVYSIIFVGVLTVIIDYSVDQGVDQDHGKYLLIAFSVTDLFGRLSFGQIIDRKLMKMRNFPGISMLLMGIFVAVMPLNKSFYYMMTCMCLYGFFQGGTAIMFPILVNHYMNKNEQSVAMGSLNFYGGILTLALAPMIGYFRDNTGSYNWVFHILGGMVAVMGLVWQLEPLILKLQKKENTDLERNCDSDIERKTS